MSERRSARNSGLLTRDADPATAIQFKRSPSDKGGQDGKKDD